MCHLILNVTKERFGESISLQQSYESPDSLSSRACRQASGMLCWVFILCTGPLSDRRDKGGYLWQSIISQVIKKEKVRPWVTIMLSWKHIGLTQCALLDRYSYQYEKALFGIKFTIVVLCVRQTSFCLWSWARAWLNWIKANTGTALHLKLWLIKTLQLKGEQQS